MMAVMIKKYFKSKNVTVTKQNIFSCTKPIRIFGAIFPILPLKYNIRLKQKSHKFYLIFWLIFSMVLFHLSFKDPSKTTADYKQNLHEIVTVVGYSVYSLGCALNFVCVIMNYQCYSSRTHILIKLQKIDKKLGQFVVYKINCFNIKIIQYIYILLNIFAVPVMYKDMFVQNTNKIKNHLSILIYFAYIQYVLDISLIYFFTILLLINQRLRILNNILINKYINLNSKKVITILVLHQKLADIIKQLNSMYNIFLFLRILIGFFGITSAAFCTFLFLEKNQGRYSLQYEIQWGIFHFIHLLTICIFPELVGRQVRLLNATK